MKNFLLILLTICCLGANGQQYISAGSIEYEVKTNVHRQMEKSEWFERFKDQVPKFTTNYYKYSFADNKSIYKFSRKGDTKQNPFSFFGRSEDESIWYNDNTNHTYANLSVIDDYIITSGDQKKILWKIDPDDQRVIAGFNCRKAQTILFDSVYIFVYYTDEINISGGPMGLHGLPGMILGVTVPRMFTSWVATGVKLETIDPSSLKPPTKGKKKTEEEIKKAIGDLAKSWGSESKSWLDQLLWRTFL